MLCARHYRSRRTVTAEGFEENFALFYLSRYVLGRALAGPLARAARPVVVNVAGPGAPLDLVQGDGLQLIRAYHDGAALGQGGVLNGLLGTAYAEEYGPSGIRYVLTHPGGTATGFSGEYDAETARHIRSMRHSTRSRSRPCCRRSSPPSTHRRPRRSAPTSRAVASPSTPVPSTPRPPGNCSNHREDLFAGG